MKFYHHFFIIILLAGTVVFFAGCDDEKTVTGIEISPSGAILRVGETLQLTPKISPSDADNQAVNWNYNLMWALNASNDSIIRFLGNGKIEGVSEGKVKVVCITRDMFYEADAEIVVGYAAAIRGVYFGTLKQEDNVVNKDARTALAYKSENKATFNFAPFSYENDTTSYRCDVTIDYCGDKMCFRGESPVNLNGAPVIMEATGTVDMSGEGFFDIHLGDDPAMQFSFSGKKPEVILSTGN